MKVKITPEREIGKRDPMIYGHFLEHFHRQIYGGIYDPESPFADEEGFREDVLDALKRIRVPVIRWPGGCFVSAYHWKDAVGSRRQPFFDKAWRVEDPAKFGTDEFIRFCRKVGCEPYFCTNAGTGTPEEMSDWVEYCNLEKEGKYARWRIANGFPRPHKVKYWSIGNENYGSWEIGAKSAEEWGRFALESAKMIKHVDPSVELSAAALPDLDWNLNLLRHCGEFLDWISIHGYWDGLVEENRWADYEGVMAFTSHTADSIEKVEGLLKAMGLEGKIKIAFDEWNLRSWHHPNTFGLPMGVTPEEYLYPRDENDRNETYNVADAVFGACFLNTCLRHCNFVKMANFAPAVNTRGCIYTHKDGIVLRPTYYVFDLYVNDLGDTVVDCWYESPKMQVKNKEGRMEETDVLDVVATKKQDRIVLAAVNKDPEKARALKPEFEKKPKDYRIHTLTGDAVDSYNEIGKEAVRPARGDWQEWKEDGLLLARHSVNVIEFRFS